MKSACLFVAMVAAMLWGNCANADLVNYAVGNSLTWDILLANGFDSTTVDQPNPSETSYHIRCGSSLTGILAHPTDVCISPTKLGIYENALLRPLDNLFLQPYYGATVRQEIDSIEALIDLARLNPENADLQVFLYATWARNTIGAPFLSTWNNHIAILDSTFVPSASTYDLVMSTLHAEGYDVKMIPAGHTFAAIAEAMNDGLIIEGLSSPDDLFRDIHHASNAGRYAAAVSAFAAVYDMDPTGQTMAAYPFTLPGYGPVLTGDGITKVQGIAWNTYLNVNTGTADQFNIFRGTHVAGDLSDTFNSDDSYLKFNQGLTINSSEPPVWIEFEGTLPPGSPTFLSIKLEAQASTVGLTQTIEMLNYNSGQYEQVDSRAASQNNDLVVIVDLTANISDYVQTGTGAVKTRTGWCAAGPVLHCPWTICIDQVIWRVTD